MSQGKLDEAIAEFREAIRLKPDHAHAHPTSATPCTTRGKRDEAIAAYREAIRLKPDDAGAHSNLGNALKDQGKLDEAIAEFREAIRSSPTSSTPRQPRQRPEGSGQARRGHRRCSAISRSCAAGDASWLEHLAEALEAAGLLRDSQHETFAAAVTVSREAVRLGPTTTNAHINLGHALQSQGEDATRAVPNTARRRTSTRNMPRT